MNKEELEKKLREEYRNYTIEQAKIAVADASKIDYYNGALAAALLQLRVSPFYYWKRERITDMDRNGELEKYINGGERELPK